MRILLRVYHMAYVKCFLYNISLGPCKGPMTQSPFMVPLFTDKGVRPKEIRYLASGLKLVYDKGRIYT